jgi:hypothetical protein
VRRGEIAGGDEDGGVRARAAAVRKGLGLETSNRYDG